MKLRIGFGLLLVAFAGAAGAAGAQIMERKEASSLSAGEVESLRRGVARMKERDKAPRDSADFRRSWEFWSNNHAHFGPGCNDDLDIAMPGMGGQKKVTAINPVEKNAWCACRHDPLQFLAWHRVYLHFFERVLREASGDPKLTLPFWDYGSTANRKLPAIFREKKYTPAGGSTPIDNPLFTPNRNATLLNGGDVHPLVAQYDQTMLASAFITQDGTGFTQLLDQSPHGAIHCHVAAGGNCPNGLMGAFETAAKDPIFWLHHANLDRLTQCWMKGGAGRDFTRSPQLLNAVYSFVDEMGTVNTKQVRELLDLDQLKYTYAQASSCESPVTPVVASSGSATPKLFTRHAPLAGAADFQTAVPVPLAARSLSVPTTASSGDRKERTYIVLRDVRKTGSASIYQVSLVLSDGEVVPAGTVSFFGSAGGHPHARHVHGTSLTRAIDVTEWAAKLGAASIPPKTRIQITPLADPGGVPVTASSSQKTISVKKIDLVVTASQP